MVEADLGLQPDTVLADQADGRPRGAEQARGQADDSIETGVGRIAAEGAKGVEGAQPARLLIICQRSARIVHDSTIDRVRAWREIDKSGARQSTCRRLQDPLW
jgi:hypothetical protein